MNTQTNDFLENQLSISYHGRIGTDGAFFRAEAMDIKTMSRET